MVLTIAARLVYSEGEVMRESLRFAGRNSTHRPEVKRMSSELMEMFRTANIVVPAWQLSVALIAISICLVFRLNSSGLILAFLFTFYLGWSFWRTDLLPRSSQFETYGAIYLVCGALVLLLTVINAVLLPENES